MAILDNRPTLVVGATGSVGALVLAELRQLGVPVRASSRHPEPGRFPADVDVFAADLTDADSLIRAFDGARQVFLYANPHGVDTVITAARAAALERIVVMSSGSIIHTTSAGNAITEEHRQVEDAFAAAADIAVVPLRPLVLANNALSWAYPIRAGRALALYQPDAATAPIHERDIAAVAVAALTRGPSADVSAMLTGPAMLTQREQVAAIARAIGRPIAIEELSRDAAAEQFSRFMPAPEAEAVLQFLDDAAAGNSPATDATSRILGRPALTFDEWATDHSADFA
ncbi:NAD(P)H-binding protein [Subtercola lobariae]|uniref:Nucleotide-diphosphate-sugar epimerase n=1 Tax=Subtercola lobariae TaxID=1588641 RepID=A0A917F2R7_9MICO|nr:NAD(P)H-binding protein [Subtercola lobariae]GGF37304.1 nucleotide-diphosphate-sugar epimerase [Subtercola lobariae]